MRSLTFLSFLMISVVVSPAKIYVWLQDSEVGRANTWEIYKEQFTSSNGFVLEYVLDQSISSIAADLYINKLKAIEGDHDVILIGHGPGGLIARSIQLLSPQVKGIITIGTSHAGSTLLKNTLRGDTYDFFSKAIRMVNNAIEKSTMTEINSRTPVDIITALIMMPVTTFKNKTVAVTLNELKLNYQAEIGKYAINRSCTKDILPNSTYIRTINSITTNVPILNIYGAEDYWQVERMMGSLNNITKAQCLQNIDTSYDMEFVTGMQSALGAIYQIQNMHNLVYNALTLPAILSPWVWQSREFVLGAKYEWSLIDRYLAIGMHADFAGNIGAFDYRSHKYCIPERLAINQLSCTQKYLPYIIDNDGMISRNDVVSPLFSGSHIHHIKVTKLNHLEVGNHAGMRELLEGIINFSTHGQTFAQ